MIEYYSSRLVNSSQLIILLTLYSIRLSLFINMTYHSISFFSGLGKNLLQPLQQVYHPLYWSPDHPKVDDPSEEVNKNNNIKC